MLGMRWCVRDESGFKMYRRMTRTTKLALTAEWYQHFFVGSRGMRADGRARRKRHEARMQRSRLRRSLEKRDI